MSADRLVGIDYRREALIEFKKRFENTNQNNDALCLDLLNSDEVIRGLGKYDWVSSGGLVEHFYGRSLEKLLEVHDDLCEDNGFGNGFD